MFGKLLKYEWTAMIKRLLPVYAATIVITLINGLLWNGPTTGNAIRMILPETVYGFLQVILIFLYAVVLAGLCIVTILFLAERFYKGLLKEEGYLMFTLPVKAWQLVFSKAVVAFAASVLSCVIGSFSFLWLIMGTPGALLALPKAAAELFHEGLSHSYGMTFQFILVTAEMLLLFIVSGLSAIYHFYLSMSLGQLSRTHRVLWSVVWYILISILFSIAGWTILFTLSFGVSSISESSLQWLQNFIYGIAATEGERVFLAVHMVLCIFMGIEIVTLLLEMLPTHWILEHRLNLE